MESPSFDSLEQSHIMGKLIVLMIDGVSADHYAQDKGRFPHFAALEARGFRIERLYSEVLGTSLPGRTSILTGATADVSGVYGNKIWDGEQFRYANPNDIRVPTLPQRAKAAGMDVASIGFGMVRPEDANIFRAPWWSGTFIQRARDAEATPADASWRRVALHDPGERFELICANAGLPSTLPMVSFDDDAQKAMFGILADIAMFDWVGAIATCPNPPDLIMSEFLIPDIFQHNIGYRSDLAHWSVMQADAALGRILQWLRNAGVEDDWNIAVLSDHGHSPIEKALQPQVIIPGVRTQSEGGCLLVAPRDAEELAMVTEKLAPFGVEPFANTCIPPEMRQQVYVFVAPERVSFEQDDISATEPILPPKAVSSHGQHPGLPGDDRFALFAGPDVPHGSAFDAAATQVAPTLAGLLGLSLNEYTAQPVFSFAETGAVGD
jgi:predicted AlkP superfamily pyrophosphatase or phosphodiesterase